jgi:hypothetical protein
MSKNEITGDDIKSPYSTELYRQNWDNIFTNNTVDITPPTPLTLELPLNVADLKDRLSFLDQEAFNFDKLNTEPGKCPPPASVYVWVDGRGACGIKDLTYNPELGIMIDLV